MHVLDNFLRQLLDLMEREDPSTIDALRYSPLLYEHELLQATYALLSKRHGLTPFNFVLKPLASGAVPLFAQGFFPWGALPYPKEHAELGTLLLQLEDDAMHAIAHRMAHFQQATIDHQKKPIASIFQQENALNSLLQQANARFFEAAQLNLADHLFFTDHELGMVALRNETATFVGMASGCKSGCGVFLSENAGVVNFGPQMLPLGSSAGFGLAGRGWNVNLVNNATHSISLTYLCRLAAPLSRKTGIAHLEDSGYSGLWMEGKIDGGLQGISIKANFQGHCPLSKYVFSFFGKGDACLVAGSHKLKPRSLDRYQGPVQPITFLADKGAVRINAVKGISHMEIIPLAGDDSFWGADFLAAYTFITPAIEFVLTP